MADYVPLFEVDVNNIITGSVTQGQAMDDKTKRMFSFYKVPFYYNHSNYTENVNGNYVKDSNNMYYEVTHVDNVYKIKLPDGNLIDVPSDITTKYTKNVVQKPLYIEFPIMKSTSFGITSADKSFTDKSTNKTRHYKEYTVCLSFDPSNPEHDKAIRKLDEIQLQLGKLLKPIRSQFGKHNFEPTNLSDFNKLYKEPVDEHGTPIAGRGKYQYYRFTSGASIKQILFNKDEDGKLISNKDGTPKTTIKTIKLSSFGMFERKVIDLKPIIHIGNAFSSGSRPTVSIQEFIPSAILINMVDAGGISQHVDTTLTSNYMDSILGLEEKLRQAESDLETSLATASSAASSSSAHINVNETPSTMGQYQMTPNMGQPPNMGQYQMPPQMPPNMVQYQMQPNMGQFQMQPNSMNSGSINPNMGQFQMPPNSMNSNTMPQL